MRLGDHAHGSARTVQRNAVPVQITLDDGASFGANVFLPVQGRMTDLLNDDRNFLPVERDGEFLVLAKAAIRQVRIPAAQRSHHGKSPHDVLGVREGAPVEDIKRAYRERCSTNHPDLVRGANLSSDLVDFATQNMVRINNAYEQLMKDAGQAAFVHATTR